MSDYMILTMINVTCYYVTIWMNRFPRNMMTNRRNSIHDLSFNSICSVMNYYCVINSRFSVIPIDK